MTKVEEMLALYSQMTDTEKAEFIQTVAPKHKGVQVTTNTTEDYVTELRFTNGRVCTCCGSTSGIVRFGKSPQGKQRYKCNACGKTFLATTKSLTTYSHKDFSVWKQYLECMCDGKSLRNTAYACGISLNTAFRWRHKVLDALQGMQNQVVLEGINELDETFFPISYKGNHGDIDSFVDKYERKPHERGKDTTYVRVSGRGETAKYEVVPTKRGLSTDLVCVPTGVDRNGQSYAKVGKLGKVSSVCIERVFDGHIAEDSVLCTDKEKAYRGFSSDYELDLVQLNEHQVLKGIYHIQHINNYHSMLKWFIGRFKGVATKYMNNYLVWHNLLNYKGYETTEERIKAFMMYVMTAAFSETNQSVPSRVELPLLA